MIDSANILFRKYSEGAIVRGSEYWFEPLTAANVLEEGRAQSLTLLGFDAAILDEHATRPFMEFSRDYSSGPGRGVADPYQDAVEVISSKLNTGLRFSLVFSDKILQAGT